MSATVSQSTSSPNVELFRRRKATAAASHRRPAVFALKTPSLERVVRLSQDSLSSPSPTPSPSPPALLTESAVAQPSDNDRDGVTKAEGDVSENEWSVWEDRILEETVPLVGFVRTVIHSGKYKIGERLKPEHQKIILERLLPYHPQFKEKIGCGVEAITVGFHTEFKGTKCLFITRKGGDRIDFSYWKCIKGFIKKKYPSHADAFIFKHFRRCKFNSRVGG